MDTNAHLTTDSEERKTLPIATGVLDYFPDALAEVARLSRIGNDKHNPGEPLHWARGKSMDQADCILRHMIDRGKIDDDGVLHDAKVAWRALAQLQLALENLRVSPAEPPAPKHFTYWYVATPYTRFPAGLQAAHIMACRVTSDLIKHAIPAYSPIAHTHPIAEYGQMDKVDHNLWVAVDRPLLECASGLFVVKAESWKESRGVHHEIEEFTKAGRPIIYWDPACWLPIDGLVAAMHHDD